MPEQLQIHYVDLGVPRVTDLKGALSVGRTEGNDLILNHPSVSRKHARFEIRGGRWWIIDLKSTNGVKVNGNAISEAEVTPGEPVPGRVVPCRCDTPPSPPVSTPRR